jgi:hypothetical protein
MICPLCDSPTTDPHDCATVAVPCPDGRPGCTVPHVVYGAREATMALPDHETIERYCRELPRTTVARLPDSVDKQEAERLIDALAEVAHRAREHCHPA